MLKLHWCFYRSSVLTSAIYKLLLIYLSYKLSRFYCFQNISFRAKRIILKELLLFFFKHTFSLCNQWKMCLQHAVKSIDSNTG